jgi:hypothetical protein
MVKIKNLSYTKRRLKVRKDGVLEHYWCGRLPKKTISKHPSWKDKSYSELKKKGWKGRPFVDSDGDRKVNTFDCKPLNPMKQDSKTIVYSDGLLGFSANLYNMELNLREDADWDEVKRDILQEFERRYKTDISQKLSKIGLKLVKFEYYSPHEYNFKGDSIDTFLRVVNKEKLKRAILSHKLKIQNALDKNKSYDGYMALTVSSVEEELEDLNKANYEPDSLVLSTLINFEIDPEDWLYLVMDAVSPYEEREE